MPLTVISRCLCAGLALALVALATPALARDDCGDRPCIRIGAFNVEWLGTPGKRGCERAKPATCWPLRSEREVGQIADLFTGTLDLDVVTLVEINTASRQFAWLRALASSKGYDEYHAGKAAQNIVIMWRRDTVKPTGPGQRLPVRTSFNLPGGCRSSGLRAPMAMPLRAGGFDFVAVGVHLKAQPGGDCSDRVREAQARDIVAALPALSDPDVVIAGDFNAEISDPSLAPLFEARFRPMTLSPTSGPASYLKEPYRSVIDHIIILPNTEAEAVPESMTVFSAPTEPAAFESYIRHISDHAPVWAAFYTDTDDD